MDQGTQRVSDLAGPDRRGVGLGGVFEVSEQVSCAKLVDDAGEFVVVLVPVVDHHAGQVGEHERLEGGQRPVAQEVIGQQVRAGDQQVLLAGLRPRADADGSLIGADHRRGDDQRPDQLVRVLHRGSGAGQQAVHEPRRGLRPGQRLDQLRAPVHRDDVRGHQVHAPGLQADPVGHGARRPGSGGRGGPVHPPARAGHRVQVMLDDRRGHLRDLHLLVRGRHPQVHRAGQVRAAHARPPREMRHRPVGILAPGQVRARRARLLTRIPPAPLRLPARRGPSGLVIQRRRQRGIAGIPRCGTLQPRQPLLQLADPPGQRRVLHRQHGDELALQRDQRITGSIQRPGSHRPPSSGQPNSNQDNTLGRPPGIMKGSETDRSRRPARNLSRDLNAHGGSRQTAHRQIL